VRPPIHTDRAGGVPEVTLQLPCSQAVPVTVPLAADDELVDDAP
jgi:hypothetical protein